MNVIDVKKLDLNPNPHGIHSQKVYDTEHAEIIHLLLKPGEALKRHTTPVDVAFYILEGTGVVEIGEEKKEVGPDTLIDSPAHSPHRLINRSDHPFRVLVIKVPRPTEKAQMLE
ncbi:MAG: cupin domain-containing protein [Candidatus Atribacteria bacterium]|nr:cupin domain-containing protein [Candidatus Atribacteria bacterium]